ncbi:DinB family protein [Actinopolymorpha pittospori]|uniref:DinB-like domain-containing protein n=1 Tax=Actinopolymorpha pittospori TaxID=648752 RepID=A0A927RH99_9ACTN|nr:DinB family protein [Actinopolymorpha pittospori]MBE1611985.1 hypothetical protein [Actinopolymorpha pittospori]
MNGSDVGNALVEMVEVLTPQTDRDWQVRAGPLEWSCWQTAAHIAHDLLAYAGQLAARPDSAYLPYDLMVREGTSPADVLEVVKASSGLLQLALASADPATRAWHYGPCDPTGFAAMGVAETLLHTYDIAQGLGVPWRPPTDLSAAVLDRLFPHAPSGEPVAVLLWSTGRGELDERPPLTSWFWKAAVE